MQSLKIGHFTHTDHGTGVSVFLFDHPVPAAYTLCGAAPASHELHALELAANVPYIDGLLFTGGSAWGLSAVAGVMRWFQEQGRGYRTAAGRVPIVPTVGLYDLAIKTAHPPTAEQAYQACCDAQEAHPAMGQIGAGTGASVGKLVPHAACMNGGIGWAQQTLVTGVSVVAYAAVNSVGDVRDQDGTILAGARLTTGEFANCEHYVMSGQYAERAQQGTNTTLVAVFTNAIFNKPELKRIANVALSGMPRAIFPVFTRYDGDIIFCASLGEYLADEMTVAVIAAEVVRQAIVNAVKIYPFATGI